MTDRLVQLQDWIAQYPSWAVAGGVGFLVVVVAILLWKALRIVVTAAIVALLVAAGWYVWEKVTGRHDAAPTATPVQAPANGGTSL